MRPLTLRMSGLRSYRTEQTIDFTDARLMAIVGETGAGKSSILEGLFFALYGGCTWDQRAVVPLISDGVGVMQVELTFQAEGRRWRVFRSASRTGAQGRHELHCLDDPTVRFDNAGPVSAEIQRLIGLDYNAFLRTIVLPQGRFQALLQASRADRTAILKGIFRLDQLAAMREQADVATRRLRPGLEALKVERAGLLPDPAAALADAQQRHQDTQTREANLQELARRITAATTDRDDAEREASKVAALAGQLRAVWLPDAPGQLATLAELAARLDQQVDQLHDRRTELQAQADTLADALQTADEAGEGIGGLASAASTLAWLRQQLPGLDAEAAGCGREAEAIHGIADQLATDEAGVSRLFEQHRAAQTRAEQLAEEARSADHRLEEARRRLEAAHDRAQQATAARTTAADAARRVDELGEALAAAQTLAEETTARLTRAQEVLAAIRRADAAAHAAEASHPGDPCPICQRALPTNFVAPTASGDATARTEQAEAERAANQAANAFAARQAELHIAQQATEDADAGVGQADAALSAALKALRELILDATLDTDDDTLLAVLVRAANDAADAHRQGAAEAVTLGQQATAASAKLEAQKGELEWRRQELHRRQTALTEQREACETAAAALPTSYRTMPPLTDAGLARIAEQVAARRNELASFENELGKTRTNLNSVGRDVEALAERRGAEVDRPVQGLALGLAALAQRVGDMMSHLHLGPPPTRPDGSVTDQANWAAELLRVGEAALTAADTTVSNLRAQQDAATDRIAAALADAGADDPVALDDAIVQTASAVSRAAEDVTTATEQLPRVADLDARIQQGGGLLGALDELARLLSDGRFIGYVVTRKQQALLAVASELLGSMTRGRYGFSESFEIIDQLTGTARGVKTLSGGETFLASLALALALVELAGRGGGRLDALFLDEGFGSLDANALAEALDALSRQAQGGRLVAVISHLRSIAENMEHVLAITRGPDGSRARWLGGAERDQLITDELEAELLS
jgi:DNA repair protein SbcC/Rad50